MHLLRTREIAARQIKVLRHGAEFDVLRTQNVPKLPQSFFGTHVRTSVARAVISGEQKLQFLARLPGRSSAEHPAGLGTLDGGANPRFQNEVHHAADPPAAAGHGLWRYSNWFSRLNF